MLATAVALVFQDDWEKSFWAGVGGQGRSGHQEHRYFFLGLTINHTFDLFQYNPLKVWLYRGGFARFSNSRFSLDSIEDTCIL